VLGEAALAAGRTSTFLGERYRRIARRRGTKRAIVAVGRCILIIVWHLLSDPTVRYQDLGPGFYDPRVNAERRKHNHIRQLEALGDKVTSNPPPDRHPSTLPGPGSAALHRVLPPTYSPSIFGLAPRTHRGRCGPGGSSCPRSSRRCQVPGAISTIGRWRGPSGPRRA
jgi:hypothetical protein